MGTDYVAMPGSPPPVTFDPAHRYVPNGSGEQPTFRVADLNNPILTQFAKDGLKQANDMVLKGFAMYARESRCWMTGVPTYLLNPAQPTFILQEPKKITMMWQMDQQVRHIYMNVPHSANPKPSWYGESVGHYEGDTLVVDTIGQNTKTFIDNYRTPTATNCTWSSASISSTAARRCRPTSPSRTRSPSPSRSMSCINGAKCRGR